MANNFAVGERVEKFTGEAIYCGIVVASYNTTKGSQRYVVEVEPQGFQMICTPTMLRSLEPSLNDLLDKAKRDD